MKDNKIFRPGKVFLEYIDSLGFKHVNMHSEKNYYVNEKGNQIRIDYNKKIITFLNDRGYVVEFSSIFTKQQIDNFANTENKAA